MAATINLENYPETLGVKSEVWIQSNLEIDFDQSNSFEAFRCLLVAVPAADSYFEIKFKGIIFRFVWKSPGDHIGEVIKTEYGYLIDLYLDDTLAACNTTLRRIFPNIAQITEHYYQYSGELIARLPGEEWRFDIAHSFTTPTVSDYSFSIFATTPDPIPKNLMLALRCTLIDNPIDTNGRPLPMVFARPTYLPNEGRYVFRHRIDQVLLPEIPFQLPEFRSYVYTEEEMFELLSSQVKTMKIQMFQISGLTPVLNIGSIFSESYFIRAGYSPEQVIKFGTRWVNRIIMGDRGGILSYYDFRVAPGWQKFIYLLSDLNGARIRMYVEAIYIDSEGETHIADQFYLASYDQEIPLAITSWQVGDNCLVMSRQHLAEVLSTEDFTITQYRIVFQSTDGPVVSTGFFQVVPETFGSLCFYYENDLGGLCDVWFTGGYSELSEITKSEYQKLGFSDSISQHQRFNHTNSIDATITANTGSVTFLRFKQIQEILHSENVWLRDNTTGEFIPVFIDASKAKVGKNSIAGEYLYSLTISYSTALVKSAIPLRHNNLL